MNPTLHNPHLEGDSFFWTAGPVGVLLSHGYTATAAEVRPLARTLHQHGYTVAGPLLPGHGATPADLNRCRWQDWAAAVEETYRQLIDRCQRVVVGGESMGALLSLYLASEHPEIVAILTYAPALQVPWMLRLQGRLVAPFVATVAKDEISVPERWQGYSVNPMRAAVQLFRLQSVVRKRLPRIRQPLLTIQGRLDTAIDQRGIDTLHREVSSTVKEVHWMERSTHVVVLDQEQEQVEALTLRFMERLLGPETPA